MWSAFSLYIVKARLLKSFQYSNMIMKVHFTIETFIRIHQIFHNIPVSGGSEGSSK